MNRKNLILTMLACQNCVHTTHAVEKSAETQTINQDNGQESLDELTEQFNLQNPRNAIPQSTTEGENRLNRSFHSEVDHRDHDERASEASFQPSGIADSELSDYLAAQENAPGMSDSSFRVEIDHSDDD
jgi:hypothetical protein